MSRAAGRHFLQIPGPTNVPDRVLRAIDRPTMDHRGPDFAELGKAVLDGNHELAGQRLRFDAKVVDVRPATADEIAHGHLHGPHGHHHH